MQQCEVFPIVVGVAFYAGRSGWSGIREGRVKAPVLLQFGSNLAMAFHTAKGGRPGGDLVALDAIGRSIKALMGSGQRSRRDLRIGRRAGSCDDEQGQADRAGPQNECIPSLSHPHILTCAFSLRWTVYSLRQRGFWHRGKPPLRDRTGSHAIATRDKRHRGTGNIVAATG